MTEEGEKGIKDNEIFTSQRPQQNSRMAEPVLPYQKVINTEQTVQERVHWHDPQGTYAEHALASTYKIEPLKVVIGLSVCSSYLSLEMAPVMTVTSSPASSPNSSINCFLLRHRSSNTEKHSSNKKICFKAFLGMV